MIAWLDVGVTVAVIPIIVHAIQYQDNAHMHADQLISQKIISLINEKAKPQPL